MANFQIHEEDGMASIHNRRPKKTSTGLTAKLISWGLVKSESQAKLGMIIFLVIGFGLIIYMNMQTFAAPSELPTDSLTQ